MATETYVRRTRKTTRKRAPARRAPAKKAPARSSAYKAPVPRAPSRVAMKVSDCSMRYMAALCDPFRAEPGACVPCDLFPLPSQKIRAFTRGSFACGTTGCGFILAAPTSANNAPCLAFTQAASVFTTGTTVDSGIAGGATQLLAGLPYTVAQVSPSGGVQARVVSFGLRIRYSGAEGTRSGTIVAYEDQDHNGLGTPGGLATNYNSIQLNSSAMVSRPSGDGSWDATVCSSGPCTPVELEFTAPGAYPGSVTQTINAAGYLLIMVNGGIGDRYDFECFEHIEYIGTNVASKSPSNADTDQYGKIIQSSKEIANVKPLTPESGPGLFDRFSKKVSESLPQIVNIGVGALRAYEGDGGGYAQLLGGAASMIMGDSSSPGSKPAHRRPTPYRLTDRQREIMAG